MVLGLPVQLQIFLQLYLIELLGLLTGLGLLELWHLIYPKLLIVWHAGLLHKLKSYGISGQIFDLISSFLSNRRLRVVLDEKASQEYPVNTGVFKGPFLDLHFFYYTLITFLMMVSVILLSMLMILLFILIVIRHLICSNNWNWLLNVNLIYETLCTGAGIGLLISMLGKPNWFFLASLITMRKSHLLRCWGSPSVLN